MQVLAGAQNREVLGWWKMRALWIGIAVAGCLLSSGCHSAMITATLSNRGETPVRLVELDYPSASFGVQQLKPGEEYHYRFKVIGNGATKLTWSQPSKADQNSSGPVLHEGDEGTLTVTFRTDGPPLWDYRRKGGDAH